MAGKLIWASCRIAIDDLEGSVHPGLAVRAQHLSTSTPFAAESAGLRGPLFSRMLRSHLLHGGCGPACAHARCAHSRLLCAWKTVPSIDKGFAVRVRRYGADDVRRLRV